MQVPTCCPAQTLGRSLQGETWAGPVGGGTAQAVSAEAEVQTAAAEVQTAAATAAAA